VKEREEPKSAAGIAAEVEVAAVAETAVAAVAVAVAETAAEVQVVAETPVGVAEPAPDSAAVASVRSVGRKKAASWNRFPPSPTRKTASLYPGFPTTLQYAG
jgi:hypothetical protein